MDFTERCARSFMDGIVQGSEKPFVNSQPVLWVPYRECPRFGKVREFGVFSHSVMLRQ